MNHRLFLLPLTLFFIFLVSAEALAGGLSGRVVDDMGKPLVFASVLLQNDVDSTLVKTALTNEKGEYSLTPLANGNYRLKVLLVGYSAVYSDKLTVVDNTVTIPEITLKQSVVNLSEVTVGVQKPFIEVHADKLVVNVENSIVSAGATVMEILSRSPGVTVDQNDNISLKGKQGVNIMIDGRTMPVTAADLANILKSMPASSVDKIEIISNPSSKYDAAGTAGVINIKTRKDKSMGLNGSVNGSYGQGIYPKANGGAASTTGRKS
jgi:outer membrane receptor protein involved in Fe transport